MYLKPAPQTYCSCAAEALATFFAMYVILETVVHPKQTAGSMAPLVIGSTFGILLTVLSPVSSGSFNPARSLGPATVSGQTDDLWIWIFGPILGACLRLQRGLSACGAHELRHRGISINGVYG